MSNARLEAVSDHIRELGRDPARRNELAPLLSEQADIYAGLGSADAERLRGMVLASFADGPPADALLEFCLEQIDMGHDPFAVSAAAKVMKNMTGPYPGDVCSRVWQAILRLKRSDRYVWHDSLRKERPAREHRTLLVELAETLLAIMSKGVADAARVGPLIREKLAEEAFVFPPAVRGMLAEAGERLAREPESPCCCAADDAPGGGGLARASMSVEPPWNEEFEDQDGLRFRFHEFFKGRQSVVAFFYTRCENPEKCSLTIANLARLQQLMSQDQSLVDVNLAAITYDPAFDTPARLATYGRDRGLRFTSRARMLRTTGSLDALKAYFELGVSLGPSTVGMHRVELAVLNRSCDVVHRLQRRRWTPEEVLAAL